MVLEENPHIRYFNNERGYVRCRLTPEEWRTDYRVVPYVDRPGAPIRTRASFVLQNGDPVAQQVGGQTSAATRTVPEDAPVPRPDEP